MRLPFSRKKEKNEDKEVNDVIYLDDKSKRINENEEEISETEKMRRYIEEHGSYPGRELTLKDEKIIEPSPEMDSIKEKSYMDSPGKIGYGQVESRPTDSDDGVVDYNQTQKDFRNSEDELYFVKKKIVLRSSYSIIDCLEYFPSDDDILEYSPRFGGGTYKIFCGRKPTNLRKVFEYKVNLPTRHLSIAEANAIQGKSIAKWKEITEQINNLSGYSCVNSGYGGGGNYEGGFVNIPNTREGFMQYILQEERRKQDELRQDLKEMRKSMDEIRDGGGGGIQSELGVLNNLLTMKQGLDNAFPSQPPNPYLQVLESKTGQKLLEEISDLAEFAKNRWDAKQYEDRLKRAEQNTKNDEGRRKKLIEQNKQLRKRLDNSQTITTKTTDPGQKEGIKLKAKDVVHMYVKKMMELTKNKIPEDVIEAAVRHVLLKNPKATPKVILKNIYILLQDIEKVQDVAFAIDKYIMSGKKTTKEAAAYIIQNYPQHAEDLVKYTYEEILTKAEPYEDTKTLGKMVGFFKNEGVKKSIEEVLGYIKVYYRNKEIKEQQQIEETSEESEEGEK